MRLDHLLSTEFSGRLSGVCCVPPSSMMVVDVVGVAGVEEIMGFGPLVRGVVWVCFWVPGPPPHRLWCGVVPPVVVVLRVFLWGVFGARVVV